MTTKPQWLILLIWLFVGVSPLAANAGGDAETLRVSVASDGSEGNFDSFPPEISGDGRWVVFSSSASNLVSNDQNNSEDIFLYDRITGSTTRVSVASDGTEANGLSDTPVVSGDGRYIVFDSDATNLVAGDTNNQSDVFLHDRDTGTTTLISVNSDGVQGNHYSGQGDISDNGQFISFYSIASNLVPGDTGIPDIYVHDRLNGMTTRVSVASDGTPGNETSSEGAISANGQFVVFGSLASNLVMNDTNPGADVFLHDQATGITTRVSVATGGVESYGPAWHPSVSADGRLVAFASRADDLVGDDTNLREDVFVHDTDTGITTRVSRASNGAEGNDESISPVISADGHFVAFSSDASNLVPGDTNAERDVFLHNFDTGEISRISVRSDGMQSNDYSFGASLSNSGRSIAFLSHATNLVPGDTNARIDSFVHQVAGSPSAVTLGRLQIEVPLPTAWDGGVLWLPVAFLVWRIVRRR